MKFTLLRFTDGYSTSPATLDLPVDSTIDSSPYILRDVDGLGPPETSVMLTNPQNGSASFQTMTVENRIVTMMVGFQPDYSIGQTYETLRNNLYYWLTPYRNSPCTLDVRDRVAGTSFATATGYFDKLVPNIFSKDPQLQMRFVCLSRYLSQPLYSYPGATTMSKNPITITNPGNAPSPFRMQLGITSAGSILSYGSMEFWFDFQVGDVFFVDTTPGSRVAQVTRSGTIINLLGNLDTTYSNSIWQQLTAGLNILQTTSSTVNFDINSFQIRPRYWGV